MFALQLNASVGIVEEWKDVVGETPTTATETVRAPRIVKIVRSGGEHEPLRSVTHPIEILQEVKPNQRINLIPCL
jgi:hypothetical protein